jgi:hypothetical protein
MLPLMTQKAPGRVRASVTPQAVIHTRPEVPFGHGQ